MKDLFTRKRIKISELSFNTGQVPGLPKNPRFIRDQKFEGLRQSIREDPNFFELREVIAYDFGGIFVIIGGEMRTRGAKAEGIKELPCKILPESTSVEYLKSVTIKDNAHYGEWDQDSLANDWEAGELKEWGVDSPWAEQETVLPDGDELIGESREKPPSIKITFPDIDSLQKCEGEIQEVINRLCSSAFYSISAGEV